MRTLKKTLSLLLAVALVLSLTVVGASAAYTGNKVDTLKDAADVGADYSEAVGVMVGLGIIEGYDDGTLRPETTYTREQAAKIIAYMQLGPKDAESLRCTKAPFTDVAADRWSAGYIAYCVEQGIIDGMGDGTFQPEAQLTGYQWAKMLLCAVGYGRNDEYVGSSWSLNTAKDALEKGIFEGDLVGADHTPLQRQQAILYAFNALTSVGVVVYSPSLGDYILAYGDFADRATIEGTLGAKVYGLASVEGIIVDNEAMGNSKTVVSVQKEYAPDANAPKGKEDVSVAANTGLDMMYHLAKIWYTSGGAVYVMDKATVETVLTCHEANDSAAIKKLERGKDVEALPFIGQKDDPTYEYNLVKNGDDYVAVKFNYAVGTMGVASESNKTTVIYENSWTSGRGTTVKNSTIKTDVSEIKPGTEIIYINPESTVNSANDAWHVYTTKATRGTIVDYSRTRGTITLDDDTVLKISVFDDEFNWADVEAGAAAFVLDTHDHVMRVDNKSIRVIGYFTGTSRVTSAHDAWFHNWTYVAQFVDVTTGEPIEVPVTNASAMALEDWASARDNNGYYDITDAVYGQTALTLTPDDRLDESDNIYASAYALADGPANFNADSFRISGVSNKTEDFTILYDNDNVQIFVVSQMGDELTVTPYKGVDAMLAGLSTDLYTATSVDLENIIASGSYDPTERAFYADTIFAFEYATANSGYMFLPEDINVGDFEQQTNGWRFEGAFLNGNTYDSWVTVANNTKIDRGFYTFSVENGVYELTKATAKEDYIYDEVWVYYMKSNDTYYFEPVDDEDLLKQVSGEAVIVDLRGAVAAGDVDEDTTLDQFWLDNKFSDYAMGVKLQLAYTFASGNVDVIYVVDKEYGDLYLGVGSLVPDFSDMTMQNIGFEDLGAVAVSYTGDDLADGAVINMNVQYTTSADDYIVHTTATTGVFDDDTDTVAVDMTFIPRGDYNVFVNIISVDKTVSVDASALENFSFDKVKIDGATDSDVAVVNKAWEDTLELDDSIQLVLTRANVAANTEATISYTLNGKAMTQDVTFNAGGVAYVTLTDVTKAGNADVVITGIEAEYTLKLGAADNHVIATQYTFCDSMAGTDNNNVDEVSFVIVPGDDLHFFVEYTGGEPKTGNLKFGNFGSVENVYSEDVIPETTPYTFEFVVTSGGNTNEIVITNVDFQNEPVVSD